MFKSLKNNNNYIIWLKIECFTKLIKALIVCCRYKYNELLTGKKYIQYLKNNTLLSTYK